MDQPNARTSAVAETVRKMLFDLHQLIPERALLLVEALRTTNKAQRKFPDWRETQLRKFGIMVVEMAMELERAYIEKRIMTVAWTTRSLLELSVWIDYCNLSDDHAKRFWDDRLRDLYGMSEAVHRIFQLEAGETEPALVQGLAKLAQFANSQGIPDLEDDFKPVADAAKELGRLNEFRSSNKLLSKLAHPTAWAVHIVESTEPENGYMNMILQDGVPLALNAVITLRKTIRAKYPEIAKSKGD